MGYNHKQYYRRKLPHRHSPGATLFVTFRLAGSIPRSVLAERQREMVWLENEMERIQRRVSESASIIESQHQARLLDFHRRWFGKFEALLDQAQYGPTWLKDSRVARLIADSLHVRDGEVYRLDAYCIMSNREVRCQQSCQSGACG